MRVTLDAFDGGTVAACTSERGDLAIVAERDGMTALLSLDTAAVARLRDRRRYPNLAEPAR